MTSPPKKQFVDGLSLNLLPLAFFRMGEILPLRTFARLSNGHRKAVLPIITWLSISNANILSIKEVIAVCLIVADSHLARIGLAILLTV